MGINSCQFHPSSVMRVARFVIFLCRQEQKYCGTCIFICSELFSCGILFISHVR